MEKPKICIVMWYNDGHKDFGDINYKINKAYCDKHGYDIIRDCERRIPKREVHFERVALVEKYLDDYDYVVWVDADMYIYVDSPPLDFILNDYKDKDFIFSNDALNVYKGELAINSGIFIVKNTENSKEILDLWGRNDHLNRHRVDGFRDQGVIRLIFQTNGRELVEHCTLAPFGFFQQYYDGKLCSVNDRNKNLLSLEELKELWSRYDMQKPFAIHGAGCENDERIKCSTDYYESLNSKQNNDGKKCD